MRPYSSLRAAATESSVDRGLQLASLISAPASARVTASMPVLASVWSAIPTFRPASGFSSANLFLIAMRAGMWSSTQWSLSDPFSTRSSI